MSKRFASLGLLAALVANPVPAQGDVPKAAKSQQAKPTSLQRQAFAKFQDLKASMRRLQKLLSDSDSNKAKRLKAGFGLMSEKKVESQMREIEDLLKLESWEPSLRKMKRVQDDLRLLLSLLLDRDVDLQKLLEEIVRLEGFKKKVEKLIEEQKAEKEWSKQAEKIEKQFEAIERSKADVKKLIGEQKALKAATESKGAGKKDSAPLADKQGELKEDAANLEDDLKEIEARAKEIEAASDPKRVGPKEGKPKEGKPGEGKPSKASSAAGKASESMDRSQNKLGNDQPESSLDDQEKALDDLQKAADELVELEEEVRRKLMELPFDRLAREQLKTMEKTHNLADEMEKAESEGEGEGEGEGESGKPVPGKDNIEQAVPKQKNAAGSLKKVKPGKAKKKQKDAQDDLEEAKKKLEDALAQLRQELQEEVLRALEERFTAMLAKQRELTRDTVLTHKWRGRIEALVQQGVTPAAVRNRCLKLATAERQLEQESRDALTLIEAEGSAAVFPEVVRTLADDFVLAGSMLDGFDTGETTQALQKQIEKVLETLIDALTKRIEQLEGEGNGESDGENPLIDLLSELRLLKLLQEGVNGKTKQVNKLAQGSKKRTKLAGLAAKKQGRVEELTRMLARKVEKEDAGEGDGR